MSIDKNFLLNCTSIVIAFLFTATLSFTVILRVKKRWPTVVNCWFCNKNTKISRSEIHWWLCSHCQQYNGFSENGDYNCTIPEQYQTPKHKRSKYYCAINKTSFGRNSSKLCETCNRYESIKLAHLSEFEASNPKGFDSEVENFKRMLEAEYPLCVNCRVNVNKVLKKQSVWLTQYRMLQYKQNIASLFSYKNEIDKIIGIALMILSSAIAYYPKYWILSAVGTGLQLIRCFFGNKMELKSSTCLLLLWFSIIHFTYFKERTLFGVKQFVQTYSKQNLNLSWIPINYITSHHLVIVLASAIGLINICRANKSTKKHDLSFKKIESPNKSSSISGSFSDSLDTSDSVILNGGSSKSMKNNREKKRLSPVNITNLLTTPLSLEAPVPLRPTYVTTSSKSFSPSFNEGLYQNNLRKSNASTFASMSFEKCLLNDNLTTLNALKLSEMPQRGSRTVKIFQTKEYGKTSSELFFNKLNKEGTGKKFVLTPPKLKSVTQASWVAGGYWQPGGDLQTLSRSSSQSSGFGSTGSNFAPSICNDYDRCSVVSEATQHCYSPKSSFYGQNSQSTFSRPESPVYSHFSKASHESSFHRQMSSASSTCSCQYSSASCTNHCQHNQSFSNAPFPQTNYQSCQTAQYTTFLSNPAWFPALLCVSLVFNMVVLCATLLR